MKKIIKRAFNSTTNTVCKILLPEFDNLPKFENDKQVSANGAKRKTHSDPPWNLTLELIGFGALGLLI